MDLRLAPTSLVVVPVILSIDENASAQNFMAIAHYDYPLAPAVIPPRDVSSDPLTVWSSSNTSVALVSTVGSVTPVSDLDVGAASVQISATYGGKTAWSNVTVTGILPPPTPIPPTPPAGGQGGGSNTRYDQPAVDGGPPATIVPPVVPPASNTTPQANNALPIEPNNNPLIDSCFFSCFMFLHL